MRFPSVEVFHVQDVNTTFVDTGSFVEVTCIFTSSNDSRGCQVVFECEKAKQSENLQYILTLLKNSSSSNCAIGSLPCVSTCPSYIMSVFDVYDDGSIAKAPAVIRENVTCPEKLNSISPEPTHQSCKCFDYENCISYSVYLNYP